MINQTAYVKLTFVTYYKQFLEEKMVKTKDPEKMATNLKAEIVELKAKLKKAEAELKTLKASGKGMTVKERKNLEAKLEKIFNEGYQTAMRDIEKAEDAFKKHMDKAAAEFEKQTLPKLKKAVTSKGKKSKNKAKKSVSKTAKTKRGHSSKTQ